MLFRSYAQSGANSIQIVSLTGNYDLINDGNYSNTDNYLRDVVYPGDHIKISNNQIELIQSIDYDNRIIYTANNLNVSGSLYNPSSINVTRSFICDTIGINYNLAYKYLLGSGNTVTNIVVDGFELQDEHGNVIYVPLII